jgi:hypothetical protein
VRVPGEDQLFQEEFPSDLARRELTPPLTALAHEVLVGQVEDVVVRVRLALEGEPLYVEVQSGSVSQDDADRLRDAVNRQVVSPFSAPGLEFFTTLRFHP